MRAAALSCVTVLVTALKDLITRCTVQWHITWLPSLCNAAFIRTFAQQSLPTAVQCLASCQTLSVDWCIDLINVSTSHTLHTGGRSSVGSLTCLRTYGTW